MTNDKLPLARWARNLDLVILPATLALFVFAIGSWLRFWATDTHSPLSFLLLTAALVIQSIGRLVQQRSPRASIALTLISLSILLGLFVRL